MDDGSMPEIAEVRRMAEDIRANLQGKELLGIALGPDGKYGQTPPKNYRAFVERLPLRVRKVESSGKKIILSLDDDLYAIMGLGMTGHWTREPTGRVSYILEYEGGRLYFEDARKFAHLHLFTTLAAFRQGKKQYAPGIDPLASEVSIEDWTRLVRNPRRKETKLVAFLMDQKSVSGIGNYLAAEIMFAARFKPSRSLGSLSDDDIARLKRETDRIVRESYRANGLTIRNYSDVDGNLGEFRCQVYGQTEYQGHEVKPEIFYNQRTTYWVPELQH